MISFSEIMIVVTEIHFQIIRKIGDNEDEDQEKLDTFDANALAFRV